jgi:integrase
VSVHKLVSSGTKPRWAVRWREGSRNRQRSFDRRADAVAYEAQQRRLRQFRGAAEIAAENVTIDQFAVEWWESYAEPNLSASTRALYAVALDTRIIPALGGLTLREITPARVEVMFADLRRQGVGDPSILKAASVLSAIMQRAVSNGLVPANPVRAVRKPRQGATRRADPIPPATVEAIRVQLDAFDSTLVAVLAYSGARPESEALPLRWRDIGERTLTLSGSKTGRERHVRLLKPLADDLDDWRAVCPDSSGRALVFARHGGAWTPSAWDNWRSRVWRPAAIAAGLPADTRPRDLRGSYASLLIAAGHSVVEVAAQMGHSPTMCLTSYAKAFSEFDPEHRVSAEQTILEARRMFA